MNKATRNYIEMILFSYKKLLKERRDKLDEIASSKGQKDINAGIKSNKITSPTEEQAIRRLTNRRLNELNRQIKAIQEVEKELNNEEIKVYTLLYRKNKSVKYITDNLYMSNAKIYRVRRGIIEKTAQKLGF